MTSDELSIGSVFLRILSVAIVVSILGVLVGMIVSAPVPDAGVITASYNDTTNVTTVGWNESYNNDAVRSVVILNESGTARELSIPGEQMMLHNSNGQSYDVYAVQVQGFISSSEKRVPVATIQNGEVTATDN